jgi:hypothetical protein
MFTFDFLFVVAVLTMGWDMALASYRIFAVRNDWPMGELHANKPLVPVLLGVFSIAIAILFAASRQYWTGFELDGWWIFVCGLAWAFISFGMMRVGSQISLFLAPLATLLLTMAWIKTRIPPDLLTETTHVLNSFVYIPLPERSPIRISRDTAIFGDRDSYR